MTPDPSRLRRLWEHIAIVLIGIGGPFAYAMASPIYSSGDEAAHTDYALQVWRGTLPVFESGLVLENEVGVRPPVQWTAQHPPLLYLLLSPVVGPLVAADHVNGAGMAARGVLILLSVGLLYAIRSLARATMPGREAIGLAAVVVTGLSVWFVRLGGSVYTDTLAALVMTLLFVALIRMMRDGVRARWVLLFIGSAAACASTRLSLVPIIGVACAALILASLVVRGCNAVHAGLTAAGAVLAALASSGWFYYRNIVLTGGISGGHPDWALENTNRVHRPPLEVATDGSFWLGVLQQFSLGTYDSLPFARSAIWGTIFLFLVPAAIGLCLFVVRSIREREQRAANLIVVGAVLVTSGGIAAMQILHVAGGGSAFPRYFFALIPLLAPFMGVALLSLVPRAGALIVWSAARVVLTVLEFDAAMRRSLPAPQADIYPAWAWAGLIALFAGVAIALTIIVATSSRRGSGARTGMDGGLTGGRSGSVETSR